MYLISHSLLLCPLFRITEGGGWVRVWDRGGHSSPSNAKKYQDWGRRSKTFELFIEPDPQNATELFGCLYLNWERRALKRRGMQWYLHCPKPCLRDPGKSHCMRVTMELHKVEDQYSCAFIRWGSAQADGILDAIIPC